ncbi:MAG: ROK family protein [Ruminococcaceae bacterium]|nr:ROK family protein [Oscillospiraceae bacterium]
MNYLGIEVKLKNTPLLDSDFLPLYAWEQEYLKGAKEPLAIAIERNDGKISVFDTFIYGDAGHREADLYYVERKTKFLLWAKGGFSVTICGNEEIAKHIKTQYSLNGSRAFDAKTMSNVYESEFAVHSVPYSEKPCEKDAAMPIGGHTDGCRIGFDAGGSDRKVSAVIDGKVVYSEEVVWFPKTNSDPDYHFNGIVEAFKTAASKMPRVDAIGISSAGIYVDNRTMLASLFLKVSPEDFEKKVKDIYLRAGKEIGNVPLLVANDGDVTALAGAMELGENSVLGIAMGTSEAAGFVDEKGYVTGWLNELAFAPIDANPCAMEDEWSGDIGCGVKYFSQDGVIKLAPKAGIKLDPSLSPAEKLKVVQKEVEAGNAQALDIYRSLGCCLGHTLPLYHTIYGMKHLLLLGRVTSGKGGEAFIEACKKVLSEEYPSLSINIVLPDENSRRVGQSVAAAGLPEIK